MDRANVDTDAIIPKQFLKSIKRSGFGQNLFDEWRYLDHGEPGMDNSIRPVNPDFVLNQPRYEGASILLARKNFGCGSSREHAPLALKGAGVKAVVAKSFARIFFRNSINIGLPLFICSQVDEIADGSELEIDMAGGIIENRSRHESYRTTPLPDFLQEIVEAGGLVEYTRRQVREVKA